LDERLRTMARTPLILWLIKEAGAADESIPVGALAKRALEKKHEFNRRPVSVITPVN
jgi:hypothetical protein